jgi:hypothetical protein
MTIGVLRVIGDINATRSNPLDSIAEGFLQPVGFNRWEFSSMAAARVGGQPRRLYISDPKQS